MKMVCLFATILAIVFLHSVDGQSTDSIKPLDSRQLVVVKTAGFNAIQGRLTYYELDSITNRWQQKGGSVPITVGRTGLAWGSGLVAVPVSVGPRKREGDGKSPAGVFRIGSAFGNRPAQQIVPLKVPYVQADSHTFCVDDPGSIHYNRIVNTDTLRATWISAEQMLIPDYAYGLVVEYNYVNPRPGDGSCIFIHLWQNSQTGTAGCTAMGETNILALLQWLDTGKNPLLVQLPEEEYAKMKKTYGLPD